MSYCLIGCSSVCSIDGLFNRAYVLLVDWMVVCLVGVLIDWLVECLIGRLSVCLSNRLFDLFVGWSIDCLFG